MKRKPKFKPEITKIKLNPEQAVLSCDCFSRGVFYGLTTYTYYGAELRGFACSYVGRWTYARGSVFRPNCGLEPPYQDYGVTGNIANS